MSALLPPGYISLRESAEIIAKSLYAGKPESPAVQQARAATGLDVADQQEREVSISEIWAAVDSLKVQAFAIGRSGQIVPLRPSQTIGIPFLRDPRVGSFAYLRSQHPLFPTFARQFGAHLSHVTLAFKLDEIERAAKGCRRTRGRRARASGSARGRPTKLLKLIPVLREVIDLGKWLPTHSMKALHTTINRKLGANEHVSEETVTTALDHLYETTKDRRFQRVRSKRRKNATEQRPATKTDRQE